MATLRVSCTMKVLFFIHRTFDEYLTKLRNEGIKKSLAKPSKTF